MPEELIIGEDSQESEPAKDIENKEPFSIISGTEKERVEHEGAPAEKLEGKYDELLSKVSSNQTSKALTTDDDIHLDAKSIGETLDEESKIQKLLDLAETKGVVHAVKVARSLKDYYALDKMHDDLADKLYDGLVERGMLESK